MVVGVIVVVVVVTVLVAVAVVIVAVAVVVVVSTLLTLSTFTCCTLGCMNRSSTRKQKKIYYSIRMGGYNFVKKIN